MRRVRRQRQATEAVQGRSDSFTADPILGYRSFSNERKLTPKICVLFCLCGHEISDTRFHCPAPAIETGFSGTLDVDDDVAWGTLGTQGDSHGAANA